MRETAEVVICGAGIAGIAAAFHLAVRRGVRGVVLVDERQPLTLTSDKGTQAYRNWWPGPDDTMVRLMNRSITLLEELAEESGNHFRLSRRGYAFLTADPQRVPQMRREAEEISALGAGQLRVHPGPVAYTPSPAEGYRDLPEGADLLLDRELIRRFFPYVADDTVAVLHARRCGWLDALRLGEWMLARAQEHGVRLLRDRVEGVEVPGGQVQSVRLQGGGSIATERFVVAAGPHLREVGAMLGVELPVFTELHGKIAFPDERAIVPREAPLLIWSDPLHLVWSEEERRELAARSDRRWLLESFPAGVHLRPRGREILGIWTYDLQLRDPSLPAGFDAHYPEVVLRGLARMIPGLAAYVGRGGEAVVDGGYYCKTRENRPLIGPLPVSGAYVIGALSGYGVMASQAAAELLAAHVTGAALPEYAPAFVLARYRDPRYQALLEELDSTAGQL